MSMQLIKELRELTGAGMMDVKNALEEAGNDKAKAMELLRQKGAATAEKKSARATGEGKVAAVILNNGTAGALVEVNCETDFSANNDRFLKLVNAVTQEAAQTAHASTESLLASAYPETGTLKDLLVDTIGAVKENMTVSRMSRYELAAGQNGLVFAYIHAGGKIGVLVEAHASKAETASAEAFKTLVKDVAMQIAAFAPDFIRKDEIPQAILDEETRVEMGKDDLAKKPQEIREKIVAGRVDKNLAQRVLYSQPFVKDPSKTVEALVAEVGKQLGDTLSLARFSRFVLGEAQSPASEEEAELAAV